MELSKEKIDELKKLMGLGFLIIDRIRQDDNFLAYVFTEKLQFNVLVPFMARLACAYDVEHDENKFSDMFNEPQITKMLEKEHSEFIEFKKSDEV